MAGHSHWANIQHKKGAADAKRGKLFSKLARHIMIAARTGGGDPDMNLKLRYAIDKARAVSMPKDTIERNIKKGTGDLDGETFEELQYEGFGPGSVAILCDIVTDNRARTNNEVRKIFEKGGGNMAGPGSVAYLFERKGLFTVPDSAATEDQIMEITLEAGADDVRHEGDTFEITCDPTAFSDVQSALLKAGLKLDVAEITMIATTPAEADTETGQKVLRLMEALDDHDDVQSVYTNLDITEEMTAGM